MSLSKLSVSLLALAGSAIAGDLPSITAKVSHFSSPEFPSSRTGDQRAVRGIEQTISNREISPLIDHLSDL